MLIQHLLQLPNCIQISSGGIGEFHTLFLLYADFPGASSLSLPFYPVCLSSSFSFSFLSWREQTELTPSSSSFHNHAVAGRPLRRSMQEKEGGKSLFWPLIKDPPPRSSQNAAERGGEKKDFRHIRSKYSNSFSFSFVCCLGSWLKQGDRPRKPKILFRGLLRWIESEVLKKTSCLLLILSCRSRRKSGLRVRIMSMDLGECIKRTADYV